MFRATDNALDAWRAVAFHDWSQPLPPELAPYLQRTAIELGKLGRRYQSGEIDRREAAKLVPFALGIIKGKRNWFNAFVETKKHNDAAWDTTLYDFLGGGEVAAGEIACLKRAKTEQEVARVKRKVYRQLQKARNSGRSIG
jgi:hypothetical protein